MEDPFLNESWNNLAEREEGIDFDEAYVRERERNDLAYEKLKKLRSHSELARDLVKDIEDSILRYVKSIDQLSISRIERADSKTKEGNDLARRLAHNALIDNLNIFSRYCAKHKLDTSWRDMVGSHRNQIRDWALSVSATMTKERR